MDGGGLQEDNAAPAEGKGAAAVVTLEELRKRMADFAKERDWEQFHSPRNLLLAMTLEWDVPTLFTIDPEAVDPSEIKTAESLHQTAVGEVGELSEIFQWRGEEPRGMPGWEARETEHLGEELADVLLYLVRLSDMCGVDLGSAALRKIELNAIKYPVGKRHSTSSKKFARCSNDDGNNVGSTAGGDKTAVADVGVMTSTMLG